MEEKKGFFGTIAKGIGDGLGWVGKHIGNGMRGVRNWADGVQTSADLGEISGLKKQLTKMLTKLAFAFKRQLVSEAKQNGKEIADVKNSIGKGKESVLSGKVNADDVAKNMKAATNKDKDLSTGKSVDDLLNNAKTKSTAINKTNQDLGMSGMTAPTKSMGRN